jgi:hypothetical protein
MLNNKWCRDPLSKAKDKGRLCCPWNTQTWWCWSYSCVTRLGNHHWHKIAKWNTIVKAKQKGEREQNCKGLQQKESRDCNNINNPGEGEIVIRPTSSSDYKLTSVTEVNQIHCNHTLFITGHLDGDLQSPPLCCS